MKLVIKPLKTTPAQTADEQRDASRLVRGPGGIYEGVIQTYREEVPQQTARTNAPTQVELPAARNENMYGWDQQYSMVQEQVHSSWKEAFVHNTFKDAPEWVRVAILSSCLKSNLFRDSDTSPKLERVAKYFNDADLRTIYRDHEHMNSLRFPIELSTSPNFEETVHADENDFVDCLIKRILDLALKRYRFARNEIRNIQCKHLQELKQEDLGRVVKSINTKPSAFGLRENKMTHLLFLGDLGIDDVFGLKDHYKRIEERLSEVVKVCDFDKFKDVIPWQLQALNQMENANLETIQLERCRWTTRLEDETRSLRCEYELWGIKGEADNLVRELCDLEIGLSEINFDLHSGGNELTPFLCTSAGSVDELVDFQRSILSVVAAKLEQDHELSSHAEQPVALLRSVTNPSMDVEQTEPCFGNVHQAVNRSIGVLRELMCNAIANMFIEGGDDDSMEFMERIQFLQDGVRDLSVVLTVQAIRNSVFDATSGRKSGPKAVVSPVNENMKQAILRICKLAEAEARESGSLVPPALMAEFKRVRDTINQANNNSSQLHRHVQKMLEVIALNNEVSLTRAKSMLQTLGKMLTREHSCETLEECRQILSQGVIIGRNSAIVEHLGTVLCETLLEMNDFVVSDPNIRPEDSKMEHVAFWRIIIQLIVEKSFSILKSAVTSAKYVKFLSLQRKFSAYRRLEHGSDNHLRKLQDEMRSMLSSIDLASTRRTDQGAQEIRSRLSVLQLQVKHLLITQPKLQGLDLVCFPKQVQEMAGDVLYRKSWIAKFHNGLVCCLLGDDGPIGHRLGESLLLTELISNLWVDCFKQVGKKDEIERGGWQAVSSVEASHGGIRIDPTICSQLLSASEFKNVSFSHSLVGRTNQFRSSVEMFRILLGYLILKGFVHPSCAQVRKFLDWAVEQALDCSTREVPLLSGINDTPESMDERMLKIRLPNVIEDFPFPQLLMKMVHDLDFVGNYRLPQFSSVSTSKSELRYIVRVMTPEDEAELRRSNKKIIHCSRFRHELAGSDVELLNMEWSRNELRFCSDDSALECILNGCSPNLSAWVVGTKSIDIAVKMAGIFQRIALIDISNVRFKDAETIPIGSVSDHKGTLAFSRLSKHVLLFKEAKVQRVLKMRIPLGACHVWPANIDVDKTVFPPPEDFEGKNFYAKFERQPKSIGDVEDGVSLIKWRGSSGADERWYLMRRISPSQVNSFGLSSPRLVRHHMRIVWVANEAARVLLTGDRLSKDQSATSTLLPCRLYEFKSKFDEEDYCGEESWEDSVLLFALDAAESKVSPDIDLLKARAGPASDAENDVFKKISCEEICRMCVVDALLGTSVIKCDDIQPVADPASSRQFVFRMPTAWDLSLGSKTFFSASKQNDLPNFFDAASAAQVLENLCTTSGNFLGCQKPGWFDQGDRGRQSLIKTIKDMCGEVVRMEFDVSKCKKLTKVTSFARSLDVSCADEAYFPFRGPASYEEIIRGRARVLASLAHKLERRDFDSELDSLTDATKALVKDEQAPKIALLFADPLPFNSSDRNLLLDFEHGETGCCVNTVETLGNECLQGINNSIQLLTYDSLRSSFLNNSILHIATKAYVSESGSLQLLLERPPREGSDKLGQGMDVVSFDSELFKRSNSDSLTPRFVVVSLFMSPQSFDSLSVKCFETFSAESNICILLVDGEHSDSMSFLKTLYESLKKGNNFEHSLQFSSEALATGEFVYPTKYDDLPQFACASKKCPWKYGKQGVWKGTCSDDRSRPLQVESPTVITRMDWIGSNFSFAKNDDLARMAICLDSVSRFMVIGALFEDISTASYELFRFCCHRSWKNKVLLTRIDGAQGESMQKRDVVRYLCRDAEEEPVLAGEESKRGQSSRADKRADDSAEEDPDDELSVAVRQSGFELFIIVDGTALHGHKHSRLAEYLGFDGDGRNRINFGDRQKVVLFSCRRLRGFQGQEIFLGPLNMSSNAGSEYFCRSWKRFRGDDLEFKKKKLSDRNSEIESALNIFSTICGLSTEIERFVIRFLSKQPARDMCRFSVWMQEKGEGLSLDGIIGFLFDTMRPEEQGALMALALVEGRFDAPMLPKLFGKWEECSEMGYRMVLLRNGLSLEDEGDIRKKVQWAVAVNKCLVDGVNQDSKRSGTAAAPLHKQVIFSDVVLEKMVSNGLVSKGEFSSRRDDRPVYAVQDYVREWARLRISELAKLCPQFVEHFFQRRGIIADFVSERLSEAGSQSAISLSTAWEAHHHDWFRLVNVLKDSSDQNSICRLSKLLWSTVLGSGVSLLFSRYPKQLVRSWTDKSSTLKDDLVETSVVIAFSRLEFIKASCDLEYKDKETYEPALKVLEDSLDALDQNWSALAPFSVDFNNNVVDYYLCRAEILNLQGLIRSWIRKDPKEKDAIKIFEEAISSCFGGRTPMEDENILHRVLLAKIQTNVGNSLRSVGYRELKHYQKKDQGKRKRGALEEILNYFKNAEECFQKAKELYFRQNAFNRIQLFGEKYHDAIVARALHNLAYCRLGMARAVRQIEVDCGVETDDAAGQTRVIDLLREARRDADRALAARAKWGQRGNISSAIEALNSRQLLCSILYEMKPEEREPDWREVVSKTRRLLLEDIAVLKEKKRADLLTHGQRSALRSARKEVDKTLALFRELFEEEEGALMADSGEEDDGRPPRRRGQDRSRGGAERDPADAKGSWNEAGQGGSAVAPAAGTAGGGGDGESGWGGWTEGGVPGSTGGSGREGGWGGWEDTGPSPGPGGETREGRRFFPGPSGERRYRRPERGDQPGGGARGASPGSEGSPPPAGGDSSMREEGWRDERRESFDRRDEFAGPPRGRDMGPPANRIFAGGMRAGRAPNMPVTPDMIRDVFSKFGKIVDMRAGAKDFVFIDYEEMDSCYKAVDALNGRPFDDQSRGVMKVSVARPYPPPPRGGGRGPPFGRSRSRGRDMPPRPDWPRRSRSPPFRGGGPPGPGRSRSRSWSRERATPPRRGSRSPPPSAGAPGRSSPPRRSRSPPRGAPPARGGQSPPRPDARAAQEPRDPPSGGKGEVSPARSGSGSGEGGSRSRSPPPRTAGARSRSPPERGPPMRSRSRTPPRGWPGPGYPPDRDGPWRGGRGGYPPPGWRGRGGPPPRGGWRGGRGGGPDWDRDRSWGRDGPWRDGPPGDFRDGPPRGYRDGPPRDWGGGGRDRSWGRGPPPPDFRDGPPRGWRGPPPRDGDGPWGPPRRDRDDYDGPGRDGSPRRPSPGRRSPSRSPARRDGGDEGDTTPPSRTRAAKEASVDDGGEDS